MKVIDRIELFRKSLNITQRAICNELQMPASSYNSAKLKGSDIGSSTILRLYEAYPKLNLEWLITGKGDMIKGESTNPVEDSAAYRELERKYIRCLEEKDTLKKTTDTGIVAVTRKKKLK